MARLTGYTSARDENGIVHSFGPGDEVPEWASKLIINPKLFEDGEAPEQPDGDDGGYTGSGGTSAGGGENPPEPPPKGGKGSGLEEWQAYALYFPKVEIPEGASRDDIIDLLDDAGVRTE